MRGLKGQNVELRDFAMFMPPPPPSKKEGHIALHMSVGMSVGQYVGSP